MKEVNGETRPPASTTDPRQEAWLAWAEQAAVDSSLKKALNNSILRNLLQPLSLNATRALSSSDIGTCGVYSKDSTTHGKERLARLTRMFTIQMLHGCCATSNNTVKGNISCTVRFCRDNPQYTQRLKAMRRFTVDMLAMELARRAAERPSCSELQPHSSEIRFPLLDSTVDTNELTASTASIGSGSFVNTFTKCMQRLLGFSADHLEDGTAHSKLHTQQKISTRRTPDSAAAMRPDSLNSARKLSATQHTSHTNPPGKNPLTGSALICFTRKGDQHQMSQRDTSLLEGLAAAVPDALRTCDDSTNPTLGVSRLNRHSASLVASIGGRLLRNTLALLLSSPFELSRCFVTGSTDVNQIEFHIDMEAATDFFECVFDYIFDYTASERSLFLSTACCALNMCMTAVEGILTQKPLSQNAIDSVTRTLAISSLFLGSAVVSADKNHVSSPVKLLQSRVARIIVRHIYDCSEPSQENVHAEHSRKLGWYATFARDSDLRRQWICWWARVPTPVARRWIEALKTDAHDSVCLLFGGLATDATIASRVAEEPVRWTGALELLRIMYEAEQQLRNYQLDFSSRVLHYENNGIDIDEFASTEILSRFDLRKELQRWMENMRHRISQHNNNERFTENIFSIFLYPFIFGLQDKMTLHTLESFERMRLRYLGARMRKDELSRNQQMLNIDLHAEHLVRPGIQPNWPLLTSNRLAISKATLQYLVLSVRRSRLVQDTMDMLNAGFDHIRFPLKVRFVAGGEDGYDLGGLQKELLTLLLPLLLSPDRGLFVFANDNTGAGHTSTADFLWPNAASPHTMRDFELVGALLGVAFANDLAMDLCLAPLLVRQLAYGGGFSPATIARYPLEALMACVGRVFPALVDGLQKLLDWDESTQGLVEDVFCHSFSITVPDPLHVWRQRRTDALCKNTMENYVGCSRSTQRLLEPFAHLPIPQYDGDNSNSFSETVTFALSGDGSTEVTSVNRREYVRRYLEFIAFEHAYAQIDALKRGFERTANGIAYRMLRSDELEQIFYGFGSKPIDVNELERITTYEEYLPSDPVIQMFWHVVRDFSQDQLRQLLAFVTASDRIPINGYDGISFVIQRNGSDIDRLPTATTCFSRLLLPAYDSESKLRRLLLISIQNTSGFGLL